MQGESEEDMEIKKIEQLYKLLEKAENEKDIESETGLSQSLCKPSN